MVIRFEKGISKYNVIRNDDIFETYDFEKGYPENRVITSATIAAVEHALKNGTKSILIDKNLIHELQKLKVLLENVAFEIDEKCLYNLTIYNNGQFIAGYNLAILVKEKEKALKIIDEILNIDVYTKIELQF